MTLDQLKTYLEIGAAVGVVLAPTIGTIGHIFAAMPWVWAKTLGNALNAVSVDFKDLKDSKKNAQAAVAKKEEDSK